jgi:hypothetical protein
VTARYSPDRAWAFLAEANGLKTSTRDPGVAGVVVVDYEPVQGLHLSLTGEAGDEGQAQNTDPVPGAGQWLTGAWASVSWFVYSHVDVRLDFVMREAAPNRIQGQVHLYF